MNENANSNLSGATGDPQLKRVTRLLRRAQDSLHTARGKTPSYLELEDWTGVADGTVKDWFANNGRPTAEFLLQLLERISVDKQSGKMSGGENQSPYFVVILASYLRAYKRHESRYVGD